MANGYFGDWAVTLPESKTAESVARGFQLLTRKQEREQELAYRKQKEADSDEWRKLGLIQELTDLSKHQTGSDVADAIGNTAAAEILQKYTQSLQKMSPSELQANISKDMSGLKTSMDALKADLTLSDKFVNQIKSTDPNLDVARLAQDIRADVLGRRLKGSQLANPLEVQESQIDFTSPEILSYYTKGTKGIESLISEPKGIETTEVLMGTPEAHTTFKGKVPFYMKETFDRSKFQQGLYTGKEMPSLKIKSSIVPPEALPSSQGKPFEVMDEDVYRKFADNENINRELISLARKKFPTYDQFKPEEKELAKRNVLFDKIKTSDMGGFYPTSVKTPSASMLKLQMGIGGGSQSELQTRNVYNKIDTEVTRLKEFGEEKTPASYFEEDAQKAIMDVAGKYKDEGYAPSDIYVRKMADGSLSVYAYDGNKHLGGLSKIGTDVKFQPGVKEKRQIIKVGETKKPTTRTQAQQNKTKVEDLRSKYGY